MSTKNLIFSLHEEWGFHGQSFIWQRITKLLEHISSKMWENCGGLELGPERGGIGSVIKLAKQVQKNWSFYDLTSWSLAEVLTILTWRALSKKFSLFLPSYKVHLQLLLLTFCGSFVLFSYAKRESFEFLAWIIQTVITWNPCFRKELHFLFFFVMVELVICFGTW